MMKVKICPECGKHNLPEAWNCDVCGTTLSENTLSEIDSERSTDISPVRENLNNTQMKNESAVDSKIDSERYTSDSQIYERLNNTLLKKESTVDTNMEEKTYTIKKPKSSCLIIPAFILFGVGPIALPIISLFSDGGIGFFPSLFLMIIGAGACYMLFVSVMKAKLTVNQYGIDVIGWQIYRQTLSWSDIESVQVSRGTVTGERVLTIKKANSGLIVIPEKHIEDFDSLANGIVKHYERSQKKVTQKSPQQRMSELKASHTFEDDIAVIRIYCQHLAQKWWQGNDSESAICEGCNGYIPRGDGVLIGQNLYCGDCANEKFGPSYTQYFRTDPNFFGRGILEKAWEFVIEYSAKMKDI